MADRADHRRRAQATGDQADEIGRADDARDLGRLPGQVEPEAEQRAEQAVAQEEDERAGQQRGDRGEAVGHALLSLSGRGCAAGP